MIRSHEELGVYRLAFETAMKIFELSKQFPQEEVYVLTDQLRRSSRSVCSNLAEAWRRRRYPGAFVSKLSDSEAAAAETQTWLQFAQHCGYLSQEQVEQLLDMYHQILSILVSMINHPTPWVISRHKVNRELHKPQGAHEHFGQKEPAPRSTSR